MSHNGWNRADGQQNGYLSSRTQSYSGAYRQDPYAQNSYSQVPQRRREMMPMGSDGRRHVMPMTSDGGFVTAVSTGIGFLVVIWAVFLIDAFVFGGTLKNFGVHPRDTDMWYGIFFAPLLHANLAHVMSNSLVGALFASLIGFTSKRLFWQVSIIVTIVGGGLTWLFGAIGSVHIGASGLVYGWLTFLIVRGFFNRSILQIILGLILAFSYSGLVWGVLPTDSGISWEMHLFGAFGGFLAAIMLKRGRLQRV